MARRSARKRLRYLLEAVAAFFAWGVFRVLPAGTASALGGAIGRTVGPRMGASRRARRQLARAMPELTEDALSAAVREMWENLGRVAAEYAHLPDIVKDIGAGGRIEVVGREVLEALSKDKPALYFSGHIANWEVLVTALPALGIPHAVVYRAPNNPYVARFLDRLRDLPVDSKFAKGAQAARGSIAVLASGRSLTMLVDQKMNAGIGVPFFGRIAMTAPALARLALRFGSPIVPVRVERLDGCHFRLSFLPPLPVEHSDDRQADTVAIMSRVNALLEDWVRASPGQWLWIHRRWPD